LSISVSLWLLTKVFKLPSNITFWIQNSQFIINILKILTIFLPFFAL